MKYHVSSWKPEILNLDGRLLSKAYHISAGTFQRNYVPRHWIVMQNLKEYCLVAWKNEIRNLVNFHVSSQKSKNLGFDGLPLSNTYNVLVEKIQKSFVSWHWRVMQSLKKIWLLFPKMPCGIWWILMPAVANLKICTLMCYFCRRYIMFEPKKYREVICHNNEEWCKLWGKTDLCFEKRYEEFGEFWPNTQKL